MLRLARRGAFLGILLALLIQGDAIAATVNISMTNSLTFSPKTATVAQGNTALWTNTSTSVPHTSTSDTTMPITWDSGTVNPGGTFSRVFTMAGKFSYHCTFHVSQGMVGTISVPVKAQPGSGPAGTKFTITWATANATGNLVFDVQKKNPGGTFQNWMTSVTVKSAVFNSTGQPAGTYQFRALVRDKATGKKSKFSAAKSITVT